MLGTNSKCHNVKVLFTDRRQVCISSHNLKGVSHNHSWVYLYVIWFKSNMYKLIHGQNFLIKYLLSNIHHCTKIGVVFFSCLHTLQMNTLDFFLKENTKQKLLSFSGFTHRKNQVTMNKKSVLGFSFVYLYFMLVSLQNTWQQVTLMVTFWKTNKNQPCIVNCYGVFQTSQFFTS